LGAARTVLLDKTGTLTRGQPEVEQIVTFDGHGEEELLELAGAVEQLSAHALAEGIVQGALRRGIALPYPHDAHEDPGDGIEARVDGHRVGVGGEAGLRSRGFAVPAAAAAASDGSAPGRARVHVGI